VGTTNMAAIYSNGGNRWNILAFNFTKRDALSSVYKISMAHSHSKSGGSIWASDPLSVNAVFEQPEGK
jgi:hypothetical protein